MQRTLKKYSQLEQWRVLPVDRRENIALYTNIFANGAAKNQKDTSPPINLFENYFSLSEMRWRNWDSLKASAEQYLAISNSYA